MNDPKIAFPVYEKALELGVNHIAVHKAVPLGRAVVGDAFDPSDVETAAGNFPDLTFEIVHGGIAFAEETAWLMARFDNIYVNLETLNVILERRPRTFSKMLLDLLLVGGMPILDRLIWASGTVLGHAQPTIEAFLDYEIPEDMLENSGLFAPVTQLTGQHKANILAGNFARMHGLDLDAARAAIADDEFSRATAQGLARPWTTTSKWPRIQAARESAKLANA
jgi:predicted TIM-barrel fold metal-dependent hydrolase